MDRNSIFKWIGIFIFTSLFSWMAFHSYLVYKQNQQIRVLQEEYAEINRINYGLFNLQSWKNKAFEAFSTHLQNFTVSSNAIDQVEQEFRTYLFGIYEKQIASGALFEKTFTDAEKEGKVNKLMLKLFKDNIKGQIEALKIKEHIPAMARQLAREIKKREPQFREIMQKEVSSILQYEDTYNYSDPRPAYFKKVNCQDLDCANSHIKNKLAALQADQKYKMKRVYFGLVSLLLILSITFKFIGSSLWVSGVTAVSILLLLLGISLPMIILDARLNSFTFNLFETDLTFREQVMFYQNKSILDVAQNLLDSRGWDLKTVGILVICFSVIFPIIKLVLSALYLQSIKLRQSTLVKNMIYHLGKWSMADVFVVALFMTYIGFYGLINNQLESLEHNKGGFAVETVNYTSLAPGALFFTTYCILSIALGIVINRIERAIKI